MFAAYKDDFKQPVTNMTIFKVEMENFENYISFKIINIRKQHI